MTRRVLAVLVGSTLIAGLIPALPAIAASGDPAGPAANAPKRPGLDGPAAQAPGRADTARRGNAPVASRPKMADPLLTYTPFSRTRQHGDGSATTDYYPAPVFRSTGQGWRETSSKVERSSGARAVAEAPDAYAPVTFGRSGSSAVTLQLPTGPLVLDARGADLTKPSVSATGVIYRNAYDGADLRYTLSQGGLKEEIVIADADAARRDYTFELKDAAGKLGDLEGDDSMGFRYEHPAGPDVALELPPPVAYDADGASAEGSAHMSVKRNGRTTQVTLSLDKDWLKGRSYPIVLDPTIYYNTLRGDVTAYTADTTTSTLLSANGDSRLRVGNPDWRTFLKFDFNGMNQYDHFSARLYVTKQPGAAGCFPVGSNCNALELTLDPVVGSADVTGSDTGITAKGKAPTGGSGAINSLGPADVSGVFSFDVKSQVQSWLTTPSTNRGWGLRAKTLPSTGLGVSLFGPSTAGGTSREMPYIRVDSEDFYAWSVKTAPTGLTNRRLAASAYDAANAKTIVFGGTTSTAAFDSTGTDFFTNALSSTYTYDGSTWTLATGTAPPALIGASMAYDPNSQGVYLFGGRLNNAGYSNTTYKWNNATSSWQALATNLTPPTQRAYSSMTYLPTQTVNGSTVPGGIYLYGGKDLNGVARSELYRLDLTPGSVGWRLITTTGASVPARFGASFAIEDVGQVAPVSSTVVLNRAPAVLMGGDNGAGTIFATNYELLATGPTTATWTAVNTGAMPTARRFATAVWDGHWHSLVGGETGTAASADHWYYGTDWDRNSSPAAQQITARGEATGAYHDATGELLVIGGYNVATAAMTSNVYAYTTPQLDQAEEVEKPALPGVSGSPLDDFTLPGSPIVYHTIAKNTGKLPAPLVITNVMSPDHTPVSAPFFYDYVTGSASKGTPISCPTTAGGTGLRCITQDNVVTLVNYTLPVGRTVELINTAVANPLNGSCVTLSHIGIVTYSTFNTSWHTDGSIKYRPVLGSNFPTSCSSGLGLENYWSYDSHGVGDQSILSTNVANGNVVVQSTDATAVQARGQLAYVLRRTYNSQTNPALTFSGSLGAGWQLNLGEAGDLTGLGLDSSELSLPSVASDVDQLLRPGSVTMIDRDGTRQVYTAKTGLPVLDVNVAAVAKSALGLIGGGALQASAGGATVCVDVAYQAPPGVHTAMWRYVKLGSGTCSNLAGASKSVLGFATERTDRLHAEYDATGRLTDLVDQAGVSLRYVYDQTTGQEFSGLLTGVYEPRSCTTPPSAGQMTGTNATCRGFRVTRTSVPSANPPGTITTTSVTDPAGRVTAYETFKSSTLGALRTLDRVVNPSGQGQITYTYSQSQHAVPGAPNTNTSDPGEISKLWGCSTKAYLLCSIRDANGNVTYLKYKAGGNGVAAGAPAVERVTDRRNTPTVYDYTPNSNGTGGTTIAVTGADNTTKQQKAYLGIDAYDRVAILREGGVGDPTSTGYDATHETDWTWDTDYTVNVSSVYCAIGVTTRQNNLCNVTRKGSPNAGSTGVPTPDEVSDFYYDDTGLPVRLIRTVGTQSLTTTYAYRRQWATGSSLIVGDQSVTGGGAISYGNTPTTFAPVFYTLADVRQTLNPRGNASGATIANFTTTYTLDTPPSGIHDFSQPPPTPQPAAQPTPNLTPLNPPCASLSSESYNNTGLVCATTIPLDANTSASTNYQYDLFGAKTRQERPEGGVYEYVYNGANSTDLTTLTAADGWLARVKDPAQSFVAFAYDRAGNVARTWDRDATGKTAATRNATYTGALAGLTAPATYVATLYDDGNVTDTSGYDAPWRDQVVARDQLGNTARVEYDQNGNPTRLTSARGNVTRNEYEPDDQLKSTILPGALGGPGQTATINTYDQFGNLVRTSEPNASTSASNEAANPKASAYTYDLVNRLSRVDIARSDAIYTDAQGAKQVPAGCADNTSRGYVASLNANLVCTARTVYDTIDNPIRVSDSGGQNTDSVYDAVHRLVSRTTPANGSSGGAPKTQYLYDENGNVTVVCLPRLFTTEASTATYPTAACASWWTSPTATTARPFTIQNEYDYADRPVAAVTWRNAKHTFQDVAYAPQSTSDSTLFELKTSTVYDKNGNVKEARNPAYHAGGSTPILADWASRKTVATFDALDRMVSLQRPPHGDAAGTALGTPTSTRYQYSLAGDLLAVVEPGSAGDNVDTATRLTGYAYDAAHRRTDAVAAMQLAAATTNPPTFATRDATTGDDTLVTTSYTAIGTSQNLHTRWAYDADGNVTDVYEPRAFTAAGTLDDTFHTHTDIDVDGRISATSVPRYSDSITDPVSGGTAVATQCPTGVTGYPTDVHVCKTSFQYDYVGNLVRTDLSTRTAAATNRYRTASYTFDDLLASSTSPDPSTAGDRVTTVTRFLDGRGDDVISVDALGQITKTDRFASGLPSTVTAPPGPASARTGNQALEHKTTFTYDVDGNTLTTTQPVTLDISSGTFSTATTSRNEYTMDGMVSVAETPASVDGAGTATSTIKYGYDFDGNLSRTQSGNSVAKTGPFAPTPNIATNAHSVITQHWPDGSVKAILQPTKARTDSHASDQFRRTRFAYDDAGRKTRQGVDVVSAETTSLGNTSPFSGVQTYEYYPSGLLKNETGRGGLNEIAYTYDAAGNGLTVRDIPNGGTAVQTTNTYYADGLLRTVSQSGRQTSYSYNGLGAQLARGFQDASATRTARFTLGDADESLEVTDPLSGGTTTFTNDKLGRLKTQQDSLSDLTARWDYNADNTLMRHLVHSTSLDPNYQTPLVQQQYTYDELGRILTQTSGGLEYPASVTQAYSYYRSGTVRSFKNGVNTAQTANYDLNANRTSWQPTPGTTQTFTYGADDSIASGPSFPTDTTADTYRYDEFGNQTGDGCGGVTAGVANTNLTYDTLDRLKQRVTTAGSNCGNANTSTYVYDGYDRQIAHTDTVSGSAVRTNVFYEGATQAVQAEQTETGTDTGETVYALDNADGPLGLTRTSPGTDVRNGSQRIFDDGQGNLATVTKTTTVGTLGLLPSQVLCDARYDAFGNAASGDEKSCQGTAAAALTANGLGFGALRRDLSGSYQMGSRTYDPAKGSFLTQDSYRAGNPAATAGLSADPLTANRYSFVNGDPVNLIDPSGHGWCGWCKSAWNGAKGGYRSAKDFTGDVFNVLTDLASTAVYEAWDFTQYEVNDLRQQISAASKQTYNVVKTVAKTQVKVLTTTAKAVKTSAEAVGNAASAVSKGAVKLAQYCAGDGAATCLKTAGAIVVGVAAMAACPATAGVGCALAAAVVSGAIGGAMTCGGGQSLAKCALTGAAISGATLGLGKVAAPLLRKAGAAVATRLGGRLGSAFGSAAEDVPTVVFSRTRAPGLAQNFDDAVANGAPTRLNRVSGAARDANRRAALRGQAPAPAGQSLDEYPFACSAQGGCGSFVSAVPVGEQSYQGGMLSSFFQKFGIDVGDPFNVRFDP